jgi:hypothetical protein
MTLIKRPIDPRRLRSAALLRGFGWIDHRFLTHGYLCRMSLPATGLYCLLVCAADSQGLSYYSDARLREVLALDGPALLAARRELISLGLIAHQRPITQVLALKEEPPAPWRLREAARPTVPPSPPPPEQKRASIPAGLNLRAMVEASLRQGGVL